MIRHLMIIILFIFLSPSLISADAEAPSMQGKVIEHAKFYSKSLGYEHDYTIYLPPDYDISTRWYPVVYLLHGFTDDDDGWVRFGRVNAAMDMLLRKNEFPPMIIVMPDGKLSWYINSVDGKENFEDMIIKDLMPHIDMTYRTLAGRDNKGVAGLSMGGYGAIHLALRNVDTFSIVGALSSGIHTDEEMRSMTDERYEELYHGMFGQNLKADARLNEHWKSYNPLDLAGTLRAEKMKKIKWYIACGDEDALLPGNQELNKIFFSRGIPHEYRIDDGGHTWQFWRQYIVEVLKFMGKHFGR